MSRNQGARRAGGHPISINGILDNAMRAVKDAQIAVAQIQNISDIDKAPPYISPNTSLVNPMTGERIPPTGASSSASAARQPVTKDNSAIKRTYGTPINIVNSLQIGHYNTMYVQTGRQQNQEVEEDSSSDSDNFDNEEDVQEQG
ncbi:uncharacterized protein LOC124126860 [Haliotis rufescens]|uniref:uncharacterized protein LOC124126860 n=1 Tax=Haliotis rufescens TaxID=6454 RepID=UPI00201E8AF4|nr:uncharacterized protein LOC124126860 [Haliotis rufescens]